MAATVEIDYYYGAGPSRASAETGVKFNREDTQTGTTPVPIPTATGTNYSWHKAFALYCTAGGGSTSGSNRKIYMNGSATAHLIPYWTLFATDTYNQADAADITDNGTTDDAVPPTGSYGQAWATVKTSAGSADTWDATSNGFVNSTKNGKYVVVTVGVASTYAGGAGSNISLPDLKYQYDEA